MLGENLFLFFTSLLSLLLPLLSFPPSCSAAKTAPVGKVVLIGDSGAGKSCLFNALGRYPYDPHTPSTIGICVLPLSSFSPKHDKTVHVLVWDTAGQERFRSVVPSHMRGANVILAVFDMTDNMHMASLINHYKAAIEDAQESGSKVILVGAKYDIITRAVRNHEQIDYFDKDDIALCAMENGFDGSIVVSSADCINIGVLQRMIADLAGDSMQDRPKETVGTINFDAEPEPSWSCCSII